MTNSSFWNEILSILVCKQSIFTDKPPLSTYYRKNRTNLNYTTERTLSVLLKSRSQMHNHFYAIMTLIVLLGIYDFLCMVYKNTHIHKTTRKGQTIPLYGMQWLFQEAHKITVTHKRRGKKRKLHAHTYVSAYLNACFE